MSDEHSLTASDQRNITEKLGCGRKFQSGTGIHDSHSGSPSCPPRVVESVVRSVALDASYNIHDSNALRKSYGIAGDTLNSRKGY